ncbi:MAG: hypothetical protein PHC84_01850 [Clostridia bacterium]|nr:hypothetical protein [Clostridia bacterium]
MEKKNGCISGLALGSVLRFIVSTLELILKIVINLLVFFGLWLPLVYALFGLGLYLGFHFNPLDWTLEGQLYVSGFVTCVLCSLIITIRNLIVRPAKSVFYGFKTPLWTRKKDENIELVEIKKTKKKMKEPFEEKKIEKPKIYYSAVESNTLIHEYTDRFEIYKIENNKARLESVEYKHD